MDVLMERFSYSPEDTEGVLILPSHELFTMENPWTPDSAFMGGKPFVSCIPDGEYELIPWRRPRGDEVYLLNNPDLGVYKTEDEMRAAGGGRFLCLLHTANFSSDVLGCVAPGMRRTCMHNKRTGSVERAVANSGTAMRVIKSALGRSSSHRLIIRPRSGTGEI